MRRQQFVCVLLMTVLGIALPTFAQWPSSPDTNLVICNHTSEQVLPKIAPTSDGGCYISWYDLSSGNYDVYLQRLDVNGVEQWAHNGLLISSHTQDSWLTDWDMTVDAQDHAILAFNDLRAGGDWDIYAYRISPNGDFIWGADGIAISNNADFEATPVICATPGGNIVIAWQRETTVMVADLRKLSPSGTDVWSPAIKTISSTYSVTYPKLAAADNDAVIVQYVVAQGSQYWSPKHLYAQKFDSLGAAQWSSGVVVSNAGGLGVQMIPDIVPDGAGGAYSYWYDGRVTNELHVYAQHILAGGTMDWMANGVRTSLSTAELQMSPAAAAIGTYGLLLFYMTADLNQTQWGLGGQAISQLGTLEWGDNGLAFEQLSDQQCFMVNAEPQTNGAGVSYLRFLPGSNVNNVVKAMHVYLDGDMPWPPQTISSVVSAKGRLVGTVNNVGQFINVWSDQRTDGGDIYLQNINPDGTLGPLGGNQPPGAFARVFPQDSVISDSMGLVKWSRSVDPDGDPVTYRLHFWSPDYPFQVDSFYVTPDTAYEVTIPIPVEPVSEIYHFHWRVWATDGQDTVEASNGEGIFHLDIDLSAGEKPFIVGSPSLIAYPNPFNPSTTIAFDLPQASFVSLKIYNIAGQEVATLVSSSLSAGRHIANFEAAELPSGIYLCRLTANSFTATQKMVLMR